MPAATPTPPPPADAPAPAPRAPRHPMSGTWTGSLNGVRFTLELGGTADEVTGSAISKVGGKSESHPVVGRAIGDRGLRLTEPDSEAVYSLGLTEAGRLVGSVDLGGSTRQLVLQRSEP